MDAHDREGRAADFRHGLCRMILDNEDLAELFFGRGKRKVYQLCSGDRRHRGRRKRRKLVSADNFIMGPMLYSRTGDNCELWVYMN